MRKTHSFCIPKVKPWPKVENTIKKLTEKKKMVVDSKVVNFKIMTTSFKRTRNIFWKKIKAIGVIELYGGSSMGEVGGKDQRRGTLRSMCYPSISH